MRVEDKRLKTVEVTPLKPLEGKQWIRVKTHDTQNRLIRKMFEAVGRPVDKVRRDGFAGVSLKGLERGLFRYLAPDEMAQLYKYVGLELK